MNVKIKRVYAQSKKEDGMRILVDRLWPRGLTREKANIDLWLKDIAPSTELRKWFGHDPDKWNEFRKRYRSEFKEHDESMAILEQQVKKGPVTLVYAAKDEQHNDAVVLEELLKG